MFTFTVKNWHLYGRLYFPARFARENCCHDFEALKATVPKALASVTNASIRDFYRLAVRTIDAYSTSLCCGTEEFKHNV